MADSLTEIRNRHDAIIPGPWRWYGNTATDQVSLATTNRGRLFILDTHFSIEQRVFHHDWFEGYTLEQARANVRNFCGAHDGDDAPYECRCDRINQFLVGDIDTDEAHRTLDDPYMTRSAIVHPDVRFPDKSLGDRRNQHGGMMHSYRNHARYEVLGYRTVAEWEADQGGVVPSTSHDVKDALYREDFCGLDQPEATFIERAPEDVGYLLKRLAAAEKLIGALKELAMWENKGQAFQGTEDARKKSAVRLGEWEDTL